MKFCSEFEALPLWATPWHSIYTPFSADELLDLTLTKLRASGEFSVGNIAANWNHPDDPLNRIRHYNFWDVLHQSLSLSLYASDQSHTDRDGLVEEFVGWLAHSLDCIDEYSDRSVFDRIESTHSACIHSIVIGIQLRSQIIEPQIHLFRVDWPHVEKNVLTLLVQETLDLLLRVEILLCRAGSS